MPEIPALRRIRGVGGYPWLHSKSAGQSGIYDPTIYIYVLYIYGLYIYGLYMAT